MGLRLDEGTGRGHTHSLFGKKEHQNLHFNINEKNYRRESIRHAARSSKMYRKFVLCVCVCGGGGYFAQSDTSFAAPLPHFWWRPHVPAAGRVGGIYLTSARLDAVISDERAVSIMGRVGQLHVRSVGTCQILTPSLVSNHSGVRYSRGNVNDLDTYHWVCARVFIR